MRALLPGRPQSKRQALCTAHWDGLRLVAYISGNTAIILKSPREIIQTIYVDDIQTLIAISIQESTGRIAVCGDHKVHVYNAIGRDEDDLRWSHNTEIEVGESDEIKCLSWGSEEELLVGGTKLWLYNVPTSDDSRLVWEQAVSSPVFIAHFSNDAELIASCGEHDRLVKIWRKLSHELDSTRFDVSYLSHPAAVIELHWRKPWHAEQNLDSLLYTICADKQVRLWTYSDPHSLSVMQLIATVDTTESIQPRRLSVGSVSQHRYVFILDSRDFSQATERALQRSKQKQVNHAMEHLIEVANRSPEICVVLDGIGHMSAWGLENAGCKTKKPPVVFNVALVDNVRMQLQFEDHHEDDFVQFHAFAGGAYGSSLSILVHSYTGQVDWYESPIATFFDTSAHEQRVQLMGSWSGHDLSIDHIARGASGHKILSWTDEGQAIMWSQTSSGALRRDCEVDTEKDVIGMLLLDEENWLVVLHATTISLWSVNPAHAVKVVSASITGSGRPLSMRLVPQTTKDRAMRSLVITYDDSTYETWQLWLFRKPNKVSPANDVHRRITRTHQAFSFDDKTAKAITSDTTLATRAQLISPAKFTLCTVNGKGKIDAYPVSALTDGISHDGIVTVNTNIVDGGLSRTTRYGHVAITTADGKAISIWNIRQAAYDWQHEFGGPDRIQKMAWTASPAGHLLLFISFSYHALVIGQRRYGLGPNSNSWHIHQDISIREFTTNYIGDVSWLSGGDLAIGAGNQIFVLDCICNQIDSDVPPTRQKVAEAVDSENCLLPVFHPTHLQDMLMQGEHTRIRMILLRLYSKLKFYSEGDPLDSFLDLDLTDIEPLAPKQNGDHKSAELTEIRESLKEHLKLNKIPQLSQGEHTELLNFVENFIAVDEHSSSLDENALRYLYALYHTPPDQGLAWSAIVFASRSSSQQALLELVIRKYDNKITWDTARHTGMFVWLEDLTALQEQFENVARAEYTKPEDRNPADCSLHYLALNKKSVLQGLWRRTIGVREKENTMKLLAHNFDEPRWKEAALKNAYALIGRRRFEYAAAFFLLAGALKDAATVCVNRLNDIQLAIAIARVWGRDRAESETVFRELLEMYILPLAVDDEQGRWMASWAYTCLGEHGKAIRVLVSPVYKIIETHDLKGYTGPVKSMSFRANDPTSSILYLQLREALTKQGKWTADVIDQDEERNFVMRCVNWYTRAGLDLSALKLVREWSFVPFQQAAEEDSAEKVQSTDAKELETSEQEEVEEVSKPVEVKKKPAPTQFVEPSASSLLDSFGF